MSSKKSKYYRLSIIFILATLGALFIYQTAIIEVISAVLHREDSSHGVFVPFLSLYFLWLKRDNLKKIEPQYNYFGFILIFLGSIVPLFNIGNFQLDFLCFIVFLAGLIYVIFGKEFFKDITFPLFFLITMIPIPENIYESMANFTRHISFGGSLKVISFLGIPYFKQGWLIQLPNALLKVAISCSGIRYLISYFVFGLAYAWLYRDTTWGRLLVVILTIPISLFASICRLTAIFILTYNFGPRMAEHWPHIITSWIVFFLILITCIAVDQYFLRHRYMRRIGGEEARTLGG
jgi:exosortase